MASPWLFVFGLFVFGLILSLTCEPRVSHAEVERELIAAEVNGEKITRNALQAEVMAQIGSQRFQIAAEGLSAIRKSILEQMIDRVLVQQQFATEKRAGETLGSFLDRTLLPATTVTDEELATALVEEHLAEVTRTEYKIRTLFWSIATNKLGLNKVELEAHANRARVALVENGADFGIVRKDYAAEERGGKGIETGYVTLNQLSEPARSAVASLKDGELTEVIETDTGFLILKRESTKVSETLTSEERKIELRTRLLAEKRKQALQDYMRKLRHDSKIIIYFRER